jgi:hypothetical protein
MTKQENVGEFVWCTWAGVERGGGGSFPTRRAAYLAARAAGIKGKVVIGRVTGGLCASPIGLIPHYDSFEVIDLERM